MILPHLWGALTFLAIQSCCVLRTKTHSTCTNTLNDLTYPLSLTSNSTTQM